MSNVSKYARYNVNFQNSELFRYKFKREPKVWKISDVYNLWKQANVRAQKRMQTRQDYIDFLTKKIEPNKQGEIIIYYYSEKSNESTDVSYYKFTKSYHWEGYGCSHNVLELKSRKEVLDYLLNNDKAFEIGQEYHKLDRLTSRSHYKIWAILSRMVSDNLRAHFKEIGVAPADVFVVEIAGVQYYIQTVNRQYEKNEYYTFEISNVCVPNSEIKLK
jgi:hypothetical protein